MAGKWMKSLQCKSRAADDVSFVPLLQSASCRNSFRGLKDVVAVRSDSNPPKAKPKPEKKYKPVVAKPVSVSVSVSHRFFPSLSDLPEGHPSRNVVEIIFQTRWGPKADFPGRVEMVFKIQSSSKTLNRFEEYRESVKSRTGSEERMTTTRCAADGNEMMRFYCLGPTTSGLIDGAGGMWEINGGGKSTSPAIGTFSGSGAAHDKAGGGKGRRAMLVCRVIAGRVGKRIGEDPVKGFDSVTGESGELLVFDARAAPFSFLFINSTHSN
ncbi:hypothetical protein V2J09_008038 [Rumex salicifolius]